MTQYQHCTGQSKKAKSPQSLRRHHLHISVVDERPAPRSLQRVIEEILQFPIAGIFLRRPGSACGEAGPASAEDAVPLGAARALDQQRAVPAGFGSPGVQSDEPDFVLLLSGLSWVNPAVERFLHHSKVATTLPGSCRCLCRGAASPALRGVCWMQSVSPPPHPMKNQSQYPRETAQYELLH